MKQRWRAVLKLPRPFWIMFLDTFTMAVGFFMLIPLLALHLIDNLAYSLSLVGFIVAVRGFSQQGLMIIGGTLSDRIGLKKAICIGVLTRAVGFGLLGMVDSVSGFLIAGFFAGFGGAFFHPASYAYYAHLTEEHNRVSIYAVREMLSNLGFVLGPLLGGFLLALDFSIVSYTSAGLFLLSFVFTYLWLPDDREKKNESKAPLPNDSSLKKLKMIYNNKAFIRFTFTMIGCWILTSQLHLAVPIKVNELMASKSEIGFVYSMGAIVMVLTQIPLATLSQKKLKPFHVLALGTVLLSAGLVILGTSYLPVGIYFGVIFFTMGQVFIQPMMNNLVSIYAQKGNTASYFGFNGLALAIGGFIGNIGGGFLYELMDHPRLKILPWIVFALIGVVVTIIFLVEQRKEEAVSSKEKGVMSEST